MSGYMQKVYKTERDGWGVKMRQFWYEINKLKEKKQFFKKHEKDA